MVVRNTVVCFHVFSPESSFASTAHENVSVLCRDRQQCSIICMAVYNNYDSNTLIRVRAKALKLHELTHTLKMLQTQAGSYARWLQTQKIHTYVHTALQITNSPQGLSMFRPTYNKHYSGVQII